MSDFELKESKVQGSGIFATKDLVANKVLFETHKKTSGALEWINLIPNCSYNHSAKPNCRSLTFGDYKYLVTLSNIENGAELLVDYNKDKDLEQPEAGWGKVDI
jgi:hypothetical protein